MGRAHWMVARFCAGTAAAHSWQVYAGELRRRRLGRRRFKPSAGPLKFVRYGSL